MDIGYVWRKIDIWRKKLYMYIHTYVHIHTYTYTYM